MASTRVELHSVLKTRLVMRAWYDDEWLTLEIWSWKVPGLEPAIRNSTLNMISVWSISSTVCLKWEKESVLRSLDANTCNNNLYKMARLSILKQYSGSQADNSCTLKGVGVWMRLGYQYWYNTVSGRQYEGVSVWGVGDGWSGGTSVSSDETAAIRSPFPANDFLPSRSRPNWIAMICDSSRGLLTWLRHFFLLGDRFQFSSCSLYISKKNIP